jgi:hypothetical protein
MGKIVTTAFIFSIVASVVGLLLLVNCEQGRFGMGYTPGYAGKVAVQLVLPTAIAVVMIPVFGFGVLLSQAFKRRWSWLMTVKIAKVALVCSILTTLWFIVMVVYHIAMPENTFARYRFMNWPALHCALLAALSALTFLWLDVGSQWR